MSFHHTYLVFRKLIELKEILLPSNERLCQTLNTMYQSVTTSETGTFFEMGSSVAQKIFSKNAKKFTNELNQEIENIFNFGEQEILQQDKNTQLIDVISDNYVYTFLFDFVRKVAVLTNFCTVEESYSEQPILTEYVNDEAFKYFYSIIYTNTYIVNTYEPFCNYAKFIDMGLDRKLNYDFFNLAKAQIKGENFNTATVRIKGQMPDEFIYQFDYIMFNELIILYNFETKTEHGISKMDKSTLAKMACYKEGMFGTYSRAGK